MKPEESLLEECIETLCRDDGEIEKLIAPRIDSVVSLLERYKKEIELFNAAYGLVGTSDQKELVIKHIIDSISPLGIISGLLDGTENLSIADAGSGAGLPGIPLAITLPDCGFTLIERMGRRAGFLCNAKAVLGLSNVEVEEGELEKTAGGRFHIITFRAFKPLEPKLLKTLFGACTKNGIIAAYRGRREKIEQEMAQIENVKWEAIPCNVPFLDEERHLLVIRAK